MEWLYLIIAGVFEMLGVLTINFVNTRKSFLSYIFLVTSFSGSFYFLYLAMETLPMGTAYAVWTGIGAAGGAILGMILYNESKNWKRIFFIFLVIGATIGLKVVS